MTSMVNCVWCARPATRYKPVRPLEEINPDRPDKRTMVGIIHERCLVVFRALMREALT